MEDRTIFFFLAVFEASIFLSNLHVFLIHANCSTLEWICFAPLRALKNMQSNKYHMVCSQNWIEIQSCIYTGKNLVCRELPRVGLCKVQYSLAVLPSVALTPASPGGRKKEIGDIDCLIFKMSYPKFGLQKRLNSQSLYQL